MSKITFDDKVYQFDWLRILLLFVGAPIIALVIWFSHDWIWLHEISAELTVWILNIITNGENYVTELGGETKTPWIIHIVTDAGTELGSIGFETLCTGIHAIAIFTGVILFTPHSYHKETNQKIWIRKGWAFLTTSIVFYIVNILRMVLQLGLYRNGKNWDDVHYPISSASSFIAVACVLILHKFLPEFIMSLMWIGEEIKVLLNAKKLTDKANTNKKLPTNKESDKYITENDLEVKTRRNDK